MANYYCKYCRDSSSSIKSLTGSKCSKDKNPESEYHIPANIN